MAASTATEIISRHSALLGRNPILPTATHPQLITLNDADRKRNSGLHHLGMVYMQRSNANNDSYIDMTLIVPNFTSA